MKTFVMVMAVGLALGAFVAAAPAASACGWEFTCNTEDWAAHEVKEAYGCVKSGTVEAYCAPELY